jgi:hypothetical protein
MSKPEISFKVGAVRAAIFRNTIQRGSQTVSIGKVVLEVRYKDKDGQWKSTQSMSANEVPKAILALQKAFEYLTVKKTDEVPDGNAGEDESEETRNIPVVKVG